YSHYSIFVAEVASTVNEALLVNYLLDSESDPRRRLYILNYYLEQFRTTMFRQTMFAEFEKMTHEEVERGGALTADWLCENYRRLNLDYYGAEVTVVPEFVIEWARLHLFYSEFFEYIYTSAFSSPSHMTASL